MTAQIDLVDSANRALPTVVVDNLRLDGLSRERLLFAVESALHTRFGAVRATFPPASEESPEPRVMVTDVHGDLVAIGLVSVSPDLAV